MLPTSSSLHHVSRIVSAYVGANRVPPASLPGLLREVHSALLALDRPRPAAPRPSEAEIRASIRRDAIVSFEDGKPYKALRRHLTLRGLTGEAYRAKWGLPVDYPLVSADYSARRSEISRAIGSGQRVVQRQAAE